jgi:hypothetical protein
MEMYDLQRLTNIQRVLSKIAPLINSIDSIESREIDLFEMAYNTNHGISHESQSLLMEIMAKTRILVTNWLVVIHV